MSADGSMIQPRNGLPRSGPSRNGLNVSFEFFPPKTEAMEETLWDSISRLEPLAPDFVSVTYGAGGSTRDRTHRTVRRIVSETGIRPAAHLTCVSATREEVDAVIRDYWSAGVRHIVALRGDPPEGIGEAYVPHPGGYANAAELARGIRNIGEFEISVGCYPEKHPESPDIDHDFDLLKAKIDGGATRAITQFFFEPDVYFRFRERAERAGISIPIVPGIMLQPNFRGLKRIANLCGASLPTGCTRPMTVSTRMPGPASWSLPISPRGCATSCGPRAWTVSISTRSTGPNSPCRPASCLA